MRTFEVLTLLSFVMLFQQKMPGKLAAAAGFVSIGVLADLQLYSKLLKQLGMTGNIDGERSADIVNRYVLDFSTSI